MGAVFIGIRHDDHLAVTQLRQVKLISDARPEGGNNSLDLLVPEDLVDARLLNIDNLSPDREDRLEFAYAPLLCGAAG